MNGLSSITSQSEPEQGVGMTHSSVLHTTLPTCSLCMSVPLEHKLDHNSHQKEIMGDLMEPGHGDYS